MDVRTRARSLLRRLGPALAEAARPPATGPLFEVVPDSGPELVTVGAGGTPVVHAHPGQWAAWQSDARFVLMLAGSQSGKSSLGGWWLLREALTRGPGNYLVVGPTFRLLAKTAVPSLNYIWHTLLGLGELVGGASGEFRISAAGHRRLWPDRPFEPTRVVFGYGANPDSLESLTAKGAWLDEAGQGKFKREAWEAIQARLTTTGGRVIITSTPYVHNWLKTDVHDRGARAREAVTTGGRPDPLDADFAVVSFESRLNPAFPAAEWTRQEGILPAWRFAMRYRGQFTRPAGAIYDCFDERAHVVPDFEVPNDWKRYVGIDFGGVNTAAVVLAEAPELAGPPRPGGRHVGKTLYVVAEYHDGNLTVKDHVANLLALTAGKAPANAIGGAGSEDHWRLEFRRAGYPIREPATGAVEVGIARTYAAIKTGGLKFFASCRRTIAQVGGYSREVDEDGNPSEAIEAKAAQHFCDAVRYALSTLRKDDPPWQGRVLSGEPTGEFDRIVARSRGRW